MSVLKSYLSLVQKEFSILNSNFFSTYYIVDKKIPLFLSKEFNVLHVNGRILKSFLKKNSNKNINFDNFFVFLRGHYIFIYLYIVKEDFFFSIINKYGSYLNFCLYRNYFFTNESINFLKKNSLSVMNNNYFPFNFHLIRFLSLLSFRQEKIV